jgi:5-methylcytosine-specific restriction endonuclease McrA
MTHALVLNATYEPLCVVPDRRALVLVLSQKADPVEASARLMHSEHLTEPLPAVVRLIRYVRVPRRAQIPLTRRAVFARDGGRCVYCDAPATSLDHVVPRSRGGKHVWENVVSACRRCNHMKADRSVDDLGWRMRHPPFRPAGPAWRILGSGRADPRWAPYLADFVGHHGREHLLIPA